MKNDLLNKILTTQTDYCIAQNSFSPFYSNFGLGADESFAGIRSLYLHYNRATRTLFEPFISLNDEVVDYTARAHRIFYKTKNGECEIAFYDTDSVLIRCKSDKKISVFCKNGEGMEKPWISERNDNFLILQGYSYNGDERDPDKEVPVAIGFRVIRGALSFENNGVSVLPQKDEILVAMTFDVLCLNFGKMKEKLLKAPESTEKAAEITSQWIYETVKELDVQLSNGKESIVFVKAIITLIFNLAKANGNLEEYISSFPNRGGYPTHFMWDSCFQNLAYEMMNVRLAEDSLLQLCKNIRSDGKIPQFLCSTWVRPHDTQPALLGWAAKRLFDKTKDIEFVKTVFAYLEKNNNWWLTSRITKYGLIKCADGLETGQDNSPRFDKGTVLAVDMNSYLLNQIKVTAYFAEVLGFEDKAFYWKNKAESLSSAMVKYLYNENKNMFFDADDQTGEKQTLLTTSGLIPLWAGVEIPEDKAKAMIENYLLNPVYFYSNVPFPSVAYTESVYNPEDWWRGPTWMPEAWLMVEILQKYGFEEKYKEGLKKLYSIILDDGVLHELFNSQSGEGMGNLEQGWTAAIFIKMYLLLKNEGK